MVWADNNPDVVPRNEPAGEGDWTMRAEIRKFFCFVAAVLSLTVLVQPARSAVLDENCVVNILNRTVQVAKDGGWSMPNVPSTMGRVRARATCVKLGDTFSGESDYFNVVQNGTAQVPEIKFESIEPVPVSLQVTEPTIGNLSSQGATAQLKVVATYRDSSIRDVTAASNGTNYSSTNPAIATVSAAGLVTAVGSGNVLITARKDEVTAFKRITVSTNGDTDNDGLPDDFESANGLNPNDPLDAQEDPDNDGLTTLQEYQLGTNLRIADSDGDGISDGEEAAAGADGFVTDPLKADTDGDGVNDRDEILAGADPTDKTDGGGRSFVKLVVTPANPTVTFNTVYDEANLQLKVEGERKDGSRADLTARSTGTSYSSSNLAVVSFGAKDGLVFAGQSGAANVTVRNGGLELVVPVSIGAFSPQALSVISIPGFANNVDVAGNYAYVAAGSRGLQVVSVADRSHPAIVGEFDTPGNANDVKVIDDMVVVADGDAGVRIIGVADPEHPVALGSYDFPSGVAWDLAVNGTTVFVANGSDGLKILDISDPAAPRPIGSVATRSAAKGVDVSEDGRLAALAEGETGIQLVDVSNPTNPVVSATLDTGDARDVVLRSAVVHVADFASSYTVVDARNPATPVLIASMPLDNSGRLMDVAVTDRLGFGADVFFVNGVPVTGIDDPTLPVPRSIIDFSGYHDDNGTGIAVDSNFVYLTAASNEITENGVAGTTRLYIAQYVSSDDTGGVPPTVAVEAPADDSTVIEGARVSIRIGAADDVTVAAVRLLIDNQIVATDLSPPFQFNYDVPTAISGFTIGAEAIDLGGNLGVAPAVMVNVVPDPRTTATGTVVDASGLVVPGATVGCHGLETTSAADGRFSIPDVPTAQGSIYCAASFVLASGSIQFGSSSAVTPVASGVTQVGRIRLGSATYFGYNPDNSGALRLTGWTDGTNVQVVNLDSGAVLWSGVLNRYSLQGVGLGAARWIKVQASAPLQVSLGYDCCSYGGSMYYPTLDGRKAVGRDFIFRVPVLSSANYLVIYAFENAQVSVTDNTGGQILTQNLNAGGYYLTAGAPFAANRAYHLTATGDVAIASASSNANVAVSSRNGTDVGNEFMFFPRNWGPTGVAVFAYEDTAITVTRLDNGSSVWTTSLSAGNWVYQTVPSTPLRLSSTGRVGLWAGDNEGGNGIAWMGDDLTQNTGDGGREILIHSQTQGAQVFALLDGTHVTIDGNVTTLNAGSHMTLSANRFYRVFADQPVIVQTIGGNGLNDWETELKLVP
jgi:hypothetical protein